MKNQHNSSQPAGETGLQAPARAPVEDAAVQAYLLIGDVMRAAILPNWIVANLNFSQLKSLMLLANHQALTVSELARLLQMGNPAASILVQQLVDQNLVERSEDPKDRRRALVRLTAQGMEMINVRHKQTEDKLRQWLSQLSAADLARVADGLNVLAQLARAEQPQLPDHS